MYKKVKIFLDIFFSVLLLILLCPLFLLVFFLMKIYDPGPIFFKQKRVGQNEKIFLIYKFRTMVVNADKIGPVLTQDNDPRITKLGKFLRHSSIDELPQFINVIKREMSIIGPRPEVPVIVKTYSHIQKGVFKVKPGISGWAQIHGRDSLSVDKKLVFDLEYIEKISFILDLKIFFLTFPALLSLEGIN